jgi:hypothetical protein
MTPAGGAETPGHGLELDPVPTFATNEIVLPFTAAEVTEEIERRYWVKELPAVEAWSIPPRVALTAEESFNIEVTMVRVRAAMIEKMSTVNNVSTSVNPSSPGSRPALARRRRAAAAARSIAGLPDVGLR